MNQRPNLFYSLLLVFAGYALLVCEPLLAKEKTGFLKKRADPVKVFYTLTILDTDFDPKKIPPRFSVDFDNDGQLDQVSFDTNAITISNTTGTRYRFSLHQTSQDGRAIHDMRILSLNKDGSYPSIILASGHWTDKFVHSLPQKILLNRRGKFTLQNLGVELVGRSLDCAWIATNKLPVCFYASYGENRQHLGISKLVEINSNGKARDITKKYNLDFPFRFQGWGTDGYHMIGAVFFDFTMDGYLDLVSVGQHSRIFTAIQRKDGRFSPQWFHIDKDHPKLKEFLRVSAPKLQPQQTYLTTPPCVYLAMERTEGWESDYIECYDRTGEYWYRLDLPDSPFYMEYQEVIFWDANKDGMLDFAAKGTGGKWRLFTFVKHYHQRIARNF